MINLSDEADAEMQKAIGLTLGQKMPNFGNARWIDQFVHNGVIPAMADRIFSTRCTDYQRIEASDITKAFERYNPKAMLRQALVILIRTTTVGMG